MFIKGALVAIASMTLVACGQQQSDTQTSSASRSANGASSALYGRVCATAHIASSNEIIKSYTEMEKELVATGNAENRKEDAYYQYRIVKKAKDSIAQVLASCRGPNVTRERARQIARIFLDAAVDYRLSAALKQKALDAGFEIASALD